MKSNSSKHTETLKVYMKQFGKSHSVDPLTIKEDLICEDRVNEQLKTQKNTISKGNHPSKQNIDVPNMTKSINLFHQLITKELDKCAKQLEIEPEELKAWIDMYLEVPAKTILSLLRTAFSKSLDPLKEEIGFIQYEDGNQQAHITMEGWIKLLNQHEAFTGLTFTESENLIEGVPEWLECTIYRKDRILPITIREYFIEVKGDQEIWQKMPRRMLRNKALQQCARLAI